MVGFITTVLGLAFALVVTRSGFRYKRAMRALTVLPIITLPFVIGLALILLFYLSGTVTVFFADFFGMQHTRWLFGMPGVFIVQTLAFTPIAFLVLIGVVEAVSPSLDESSLTLGANSWQTFRLVILPLLRTAIRAALVYSFVRAKTAISAVIFLVSAEYDMATSYTIGRVKNNDYGLAIAYSTTLIFVMLSVVVVMQVLVGRTKFGRPMTQSRTNV